jgi:hypothetical protein
MVVRTACVLFSAPMPSTMEVIPEIILRMSSSSTVKAQFLAASFPERLDEQIGAVRELLQKLPPPKAVIWCKFRIASYNGHCHKLFHCIFFLLSVTGPGICLTFCRGSMTAHRAYCAGSLATPHLEPGGESPEPADPNPALCASASVTVVFRIYPFSKLVNSDVENGRRFLNFSLRPRSLLAGSVGILGQWSADRAREKAALSALSRRRLQHRPIVGTRLSLAPRRW